MNTPGISRLRRHAEHQLYPPVNPAPDAYMAMPAGVVEYVATSRADGISRASLALLNQDLACRRFNREHLHGTIQAVFADTTSTRRPGLAAMLGRFTVCRHCAVIVARLDRLPARQAAKLAQLGCRVLSATGHLPHTAKRQRVFFADSDHRANSKGGV